MPLLLVLHYELHFNFFFFCTFFNVIIMQACVCVCVWSFIVIVLSRPTPSSFSLHHTTESQRRIDPILVSMKPQSDETVCGWTNGDQNKAWSIKGWANWLVGSHHYTERERSRETEPICGRLWRQEQSHSSSLQSQVRMLEIYSSVCGVQAWRNHIKYILSM